MPQDMQQTLTLVLQAKDEASRVLAEVGGKMTELGLAAERLQARAASSGVAVALPDALAAATRESLQTVRRHYAEQESVIKGALERQLATERAATESSLALAKETRARDLEDLRKSYDEKRDASARARRDDDAAARADAVRARQTSSAQRRLDLDNLRAYLDSRRTTIAQAAASDREIWHELTREEMTKAVFEREEAIRPAYRALSPDVRKVVDTGQGASGLNPAQTMEHLDYQGIVQAADDAYKTRVRAAEGSLDHELTLVTSEEQRKLAIVATYEEQENTLIADRSNKRLAKAREDLRQDQESHRAAYARDLADLERHEKDATDVVTSGSERRRARLAADLEKTLADTRTYYARELEAIAAAEQRETALIRSASEQQTRLYAQAAADQERIVRQRAQDDQKSAREQATKSREPGIIGHGAEGLMNIVQQSLVWNAAYQVAGKINQAISAMAGGMLSVNVQLEQYQATFASIYQNKDKGVQAVKWLTDLAVQIPATRQQTIQAGLTIASLGDNITEVMQPLSNIASIMHVDLPRAAQAFADAQEGRFQMLQTTLHITKGELEKYGLVLDHNRVVGDTFIKSFEKLGNVRFGGAALAQMNTLGGAVSNLQDEFAKLQAALGHGIFKALEDNLGKLLVMLNNPALEHFAEVLGGKLGRALSSVIGNIEKWVQQMGGVPGLVGRLTLVVHDAAQVFMGLWGALSNVAFVIKTVSDLIGPLAGLLAKLSGAADTDSNRLKFLVQVATDLFIAYKVLWPIVGFVTAAMEKQKIATVAATDAEVVCKTATMDLNEVLGANGLSAVAGTTATSMDSLGRATGAAGAAGAMGAASSAATVFGSRLGGMAGFLTSTIGRVALLTADIVLFSKAVDQIKTFTTATQQKQDLLDYGKALTPVQGTAATLGHLLFQGPPSGGGGAAYIAYQNMLVGKNSDDRAGGTRAFLDALQSDPALMAIYMQYMTGQGAGARVRQVFSSYTGMAAGGGGLVSAQQQQDAQNYQAYQAALNMFNAELKSRPQDAATQLSTVVAAYQTWKLGSQTSQAADEAAINASNTLQSRLNAELPKQYRLQSGTTDLSQQGDQTQSPQDKLAAAKKALAQFRAHQWADTLRKIGLGTIDQADVQSVIDQLKTDETAAGVTVSDTDIMNRVRAATKTYVATQGRRFDVIMGQLRDHVKGVTAQMAQNVLNTIQQTELSVGLDDTTGLQQQRLERFTAPAGSGGPIMAGSAAADQVGYIKASLDDARAHLDALAKKSPGATQAIQNWIDQIAGPNGLIEQYDRARNIPWPQTLRDEDTARTRLTSAYLGAHASTKNVSAAQSQLTIDLARTGDSLRDYAHLIADARAIQRADLAQHHNTTHAEAAFVSARARVDDHMVSIAKKTLANDLSTLGTSHQDQVRLNKDARDVLAFETQAHKDGLKGYLAANQAQADYHKALKEITKHMVGGTGPAAGITPPTAYYGPYRISTAPYGATQASFGGQAEQSAMAALVAHLRSLVTYWQARAKRDEDALAAQQQTAHNTKQTATDTHRLVTEGRLGPIEARESVPRSAAVALRNRGGFAPMKPY